jgi:hypothetical protein
MCVRATPPAMWCNSIGTWSARAAPAVREEGDTMKAISLWQPWASAIALGSKTIETRHWSTSYRGPLAIHAAKRCVKSELFACQLRGVWHAALHRPNPDRVPLWESLPFGAIVAVCTLADCVRTETLNDLDTVRWLSPDGPDAWTERYMGDFSPGRYGWVLAHIRALKSPIPYRGAQRFFDVPDDLLTERAPVATGTRP